MYRFVIKIPLTTLSVHFKRSKEVLDFTMICEIFFAIGVWKNAQIFLVRTFFSFKYNINYILKTFLNLK